MAWFWTCEHGRLYVLDDDEEPQCDCEGVNNE